MLPAKPPVKCAPHIHRALKSPHSSCVVCPYLRLLDRLSSVSLVTTTWVEPPWLSSCITSICGTQAHTHIHLDLNIKAGALCIIPVNPYIDGTATSVDQMSSCCLMVHSSNPSPLIKSVSTYHAFTHFGGHQSLVNYLLARQ